MVAINFTLVVQGINFLIACILLDKFLFKPVLAMNKQEEIEREASHRNIDRAQQEIDAVKSLQQELLARYQARFAETRPALIGEVLPSYSLMVFQLAGEEKAEIKQLQEVATQEIIKRVQHVR